MSYTINMKYRKGTLAISVTAVNPVAARKEAMGMYPDAIIVSVAPRSIVCW
jgi:hypothetical protein